MSALGAAACAVGPNYERPPLPSPPSYRFQSGPSTAASLADVAWWNVFRDDALRVLIDEALLRNFDLLIAIARVDEARAQAQSAGAALLPALSVTGTGSYGNSFQGAGALPTPFYSASATGVATWELDVFGRLRRTREAARAEYAASEEAQRGVWVTVVVSQLCSCASDRKSLRPSLSAVRHIHRRRLPAHPHRQRLHFIQRHVRVIPYRCQARARYCVARGIP